MISYSNFLRDNNMPRIISIIIIIRKLQSAHFDEHVKQMDITRNTDAKKLKF